MSGSGRVFTPLASAWGSEIHCGHRGIFWKNLPFLAVSAVLGHHKPLVFLISEHFHRSHQEGKFRVCRIGKAAGAEQGHACPAGSAASALAAWLVQWREQACFCQVHHGLGSCLSITRASPNCCIQFRPCRLFIMVSYFFPEMFIGGPCVLSNGEINTLHSSPSGIHNLVGKRERGREK